MTHASLEASEQSGKPVTLYHFQLSEEVEYFRTSFRRAVTYQGDSYTACEIEHSAPTQGADDSPGNIQITLPSDDPISMEFLTSIPPHGAMVTVHQYHRPPVDNPSPSEVWKTLYDVLNVDDGGKEITLNCATLLSQTDIVVPTGLIQREYCSFGTYDPLTCGVDPASFTFEGTVSAIDGLQITVPGAGVFSGLDLTFFVLGDFSSGPRHTMITAQDGDNVLIDEMIPGLIISSAVTMIAGDNRTQEVCLNKFNNIARFMAFPKMPIANPYYGQSLRGSELRPGSEETPAE